MKIFVAGLNHSTADIEVREKVAFNGSRLEEGLRRFRELPEIEEAMILSTCNRVELYAHVKDTLRASESIKAFLSEFHQVNRSLLDKAIYTHDDVDAIRHTSGFLRSLDSMVVGEPQILGQLKEAFEMALHGHPAGDAAIRHVAAMLKKARRETDVAARLGGEEFAILLPSTDVAGAITVAESIRSRLAASQGANAFTLTVSIGVATAPEDGLEEDELIRAADRRLYAAKTAGRNKVFFIRNQAPSGPEDAVPDPPES